MQYSIHTPSKFICNHLGDLLPTWSRPASSLLLLLQPTSCDLSPRTLQSELQKRELRQRFLAFGNLIAAELIMLGHLTEVFDPKTGLPLLSSPGKLTLDDVSVVRACLGYPTIRRDGCSVILHPHWGSAVYPSTVLSSAEPGVIASVVSCLSLSECHHSFTTFNKLTE